MKKRLMVILLIFACVGCDQITKYTAVHFLKGRPNLSFAADTFRLGYAENRGAFLSLGAGLSEGVRKTVFIVLVTVFLLGFLLYTLFSKTLDTLSMWSSALIIGGGFGNLIDRVLRQGAVIDFMNIGIGSLRTGIFNVADVVIMAGMFMFIYAYVKNPAKSGDAAKG